MIFNRDYKIIMREGKRILTGSEPLKEDDLKRDNVLNWCCVVALLVLLIIFLVFGGCAQAMPSPDAIANAIYKAEGGHKTKHPYGILSKYKHTTARQACLNSIRHRLRQWNGKGDFIRFLGLTYSPPSINPYWVKNVHYFLEKGE